MERRFLITLTGLTLPIIMGLSPVASAQTPEPAAGNPAINSTPTPSNSSGVTSGKTGAGMSLGGSQTMASPSSEAAIPKGSNPDSGSGNMAAGSGATPSPADNQTPSGGMKPQTANNPDSGANGAMDANPSPANDSGAMPAGRFTSPSTDPE